MNKEDLTMLQNIKNNPVRYGMLIGSLVLEIVCLIIYATTGIIHNFTEEYSIGCFIFLAVAIVATALTIFRRIHLVETIPFIAMVISLILFIVVNLNYIVAVVRAIDVTHVSATFVLTVVFMGVAVIISLVSFILKDRKTQE